MAPQHAGVTGKIENCVTWVFSALVTASGQAWVDFDAYMPGCWAKDPARRKKAGIPEGLAFATKPELAIAQVKRLVAGGLRVLWAAANEVYGRSGEFRAALRGLGLSYVVIIPCDYHITFARSKVTRADQAVSEAVFEQRSPATAPRARATRTGRCSARRTPGSSCWSAACRTAGRTSTRITSVTRRKAGPRP